MSCRDCVRFQPNLKLGMERKQVLLKVLEALIRNATRECFIPVMEQILTRVRPAVCVG